ncbi:MAG: nucleotidyltransferase domain-containing protein [Clostridiaceae bacterium]|nr:nucleotidyltransferase domain-containing protein [Clostridiaceae bacterium]
MLSIEERQKIVKDYSDSVKQEFPGTGQYNVLVFGSFLTDRYTEDSDIDIGILSLKPGLTFRIYAYTKDYFKKLGIDNDVVRMRLVKSQYINISIVTGHTCAVTDYCPDELISYMKQMMEEYGENPQETIIKAAREEADHGDIR